MAVKAEQLAELLHTAAGMLPWREETERDAFHRSIDEACGIEAEPPAEAPAPKRPKRAVERDAG